MMEQSFITTRAKAQKLINLNESVTKSRDKSKRSVRRKRSVNAKSDSEATTGQSARKKASDAKSTVGKFKKKKASSRKLNTVKEAESEDKAVVHKGESYNKSKRLSKDKHTDNNASTTKPIDNDLSQWTNLADINKTSKRVQHQVIVPSVKEQSGMVTPKSTPIKLSLTPHRSTKTPKKSPVSLSSPKTRSVSVSRLLKTPRKLSLMSGENLYNNDSDNKRLRKAKKNSLRSVFVSKEHPPAKSKRATSSVMVKGITHRFSKSPKIVLRSPSKKSKSPKLNVSARKTRSPSKKSLTNSSASSSLGGIESSSANTKSSLSADSRILSADKYRLLNSGLAKLLTISQIRDILAEPVVLLKKLSFEESTSAESDTAVHLGGSSRRSSAAKATNRSASKLSPTQGVNKTSTPLMSSTPREEKTPLARINPISDTSILSVVQDDIAYPNTRSRYTNQSGMYVTPSPSLMDKSAAIENLSKPFLLDMAISDVGDTSQAHVMNVAQQDTAHDVDQTTELRKSQNNRNDVTYELKDPQTPGLRQMIRKRTAADANLSAKKSCRVRFANVRLDKNDEHNSIGNQQSSVTRNSSVQRNVSIMNSGHKSKMVEIRNFSRDSLTSSLNAKPNPRMSRVTSRGRLHSFNATSLGKIQATPKRLESAGKNSEKRSSVKKVPNFKRMHEKMFAKSESVVDARKRLESRHLEFATKKVLSEVDAKKGMKLLPSDATNGTYNRFGFKLRKAEATHVILKKQTVFSRQKQQHETRTVLKSVRTNRRFELQMKARNINLI